MALRRMVCPGLETQIAMQESCQSHIMNRGGVGLFATRHLGLP